MKQCVLIGGGNIGRGNPSYELKEIDQEIIKRCDKEKPHLLFIGLASSYSDSYYDIIKKNFQNLGCTTAYLKKKNIIHNKDLTIEKIKEADIIYIGGGDSIKLIEEVKEYKLESLLQEAYKRGCILVGYSAGAILLTKEGFSDSYILRKERDTYHFINGLSIIPISICPHYHETKEKTDALKQELKQKNRLVYGLENKTALFITDNNIEIKTINLQNIYQCSYQKEWQEKIIK